MKVLCPFKVYFILVYCTSEHEVQAKRLVLVWAKKFSCFFRCPAALYRSRFSGNHENLKAGSIVSYSVANKVVNVKDRLVRI